MRSLVAPRLQSTARLKVSQAVGIQVGTLQTVLLYGATKATKIKKLDHRVEFFVVLL
jgi:hypothetical protein